MAWMNADIEKLFARLDTLIGLLTPKEVKTKETITPVVVKKKMGRPKGSKNKNVKQIRRTKS